MADSVFLFADLEHCDEWEKFGDCVWQSYIFEALESKKITLHILHSFLFKRFWSFFPWKSISKLLNGWAIAC